MLQIDLGQQFIKTNIIDVDDAVQEFEKKFRTKQKKPWKIRASLDQARAEKCVTTLKIFLCLKKNNLLLYYICKTVKTSPLLPVVLCIHIFCLMINSIQNLKNCA